MLVILPVLCFVLFVAVYAAICSEPRALDSLAYVVSVSRCHVGTRGNGNHRGVESVPSDHIRLAPDAVGWSLRAVGRYLSDSKHQREANGLFSSFPTFHGLSFGVWRR